MSIKAIKYRSGGAFIDMLKHLTLPIGLLVGLSTFAQPIPTLNQPDDGYRGIWYHIGPLKTEYAYKYSGGLATYPANHHPFAVYAPSVQKTFFCFGGASKRAKPSLLHEVGVFDHRTGTVSLPTVVLDKQTDDAHDNPVLNIDRQGYIWLFSTSHGTERPSFIHRSRKPYDITAFDRVPATRMQGDSLVPFDNFSYLQSHYDPDRGFLHLMTHYERGMLKYGAKKPRRTIGYVTSRDGIRWSAIRDIATIEEGHYQTSHQHGRKVGTAFNMHPDTEKGAGLDYRTNLYYIETTDFGQSWQTAGGQRVSLPVRETQNAALIHNYKAEGLNVYINDVAHDTKGNPVILYITSKGPEPGPDSGPYTWHVAHWTGKTWAIYPVTTSDHNYDMGSLYCEPDGTWRIIGPTGTGPQAYNTGGEIAVWVSRDRGQHWQSTGALTRNSPRNHSYPRRPVSAHPDFYGLWADGNGRQPSESFLYFGTKAGAVFRLPARMTGPTAKPERVKP
ncbi:BNR-4 repeat-containing protein [Rudanella paleaurantiibacter]|nr:BNR-4 repeat-containing protein [Rudanella paleaurantiibacter]